jgi:short-subunit dehydrogenase
MMPEDFNDAYGGSKAYVLNFTRNIAKQLQKVGVQVQVVLPGAIHTEAWDRAGDLVKDVPKEAVMSVENLVDASLKGLDQGEVVTLPSLEDLGLWAKFEEARLAIIPNIFTGTPASRYR